MRQPGKLRRRQAEVYTARRTWGLARAAFIQRGRHWAKGQWTPRSAGAMIVAA
jgi:hypothetical protein